MRLHELVRSHSIVLFMLYPFFAVSAALGAGAVIAPELRRTQVPISLYARIETVPQYVLDYAPVIYLHSEERFAPADIASHFNHTHPTFKIDTDLTDVPRPLTLDTLSILNEFGPRHMHLATNDDFAEAPAWIRGSLPNAEGKTEGATSCTVIINDKGEGKVDAFYIFFYAYNQGNKLFGFDFLEMGNHVSDWEHVMIRFENGSPQSVFYSQHGGGTAYTYSAVEKHGKRIVGYAGNGTHATWATPGTHGRLIPGHLSTWGAVVDYTDKGRLWDPTKSALFYTVTFPFPEPEDAAPTFYALPDPFTLSESTLDSMVPPATPPTDWLYYRGRWGDARLTTDDPRQAKFFLGISYRYVDGPNGPIHKNLNRENVCKWKMSSWWPCVVRETLQPGS